ncbi:MAG: hypothetical protein ACREON_15135 [Gemmatimonadaceae bacterium]
MTPWIMSCGKRCWLLRSLLSVTLTLAVASVASTQSSAQEAKVAGEAIAQLLPNGTVVADVMDIAAPPRLGELSARLQAAARRDPNWWAAHVKAARPGEPLAYDARMGLSEAEYRDLLALTDSMRIRPVARAELRVSAAPRGWRLEGGPTLPELQGIEIDTVAGEVSTPMGNAGGVKPITANENQRATGPWDGIQWRREDPSLTSGSGMTITFALGRLRESGRVLLYYDAKRATGGAIAARATRILTFDAPPAK